MSDLADRLAKLSPAQRELLQQRLTQKSAPVVDPFAEATAEPVAIIGMSCRFAGAPDLTSYWRMIEGGLEGVTETPPSRWDVDELYDAHGAPGKMTNRRGAFVDNIDSFDPTHFGITPREASRMDPQQRMLLEVAWEALENAGWPADKAQGSNTGVWVGIGGADYAKIPSQAQNYYERIDAHMGTGNALSIASNRISYIFDFRGPSASVDTACSSSSLAIHLAVEALRRGECTAALAGGVNAILTPETTLAFSKAQMLSPEGRCRPFDAGANGYVRGEGCGLVLLKKLTDAQRDGDPVLAVLRATSVNQDGRTSGISAPNGERQKACVRAALAQAGLTPAAVDYVEAHGTGTPLGDPIEMQALTEVFRRTAPSDKPLYVTSAKANIGHTETVSGVAGLIKVALLMKHGVIEPQLHLEKLNPHIKLDGSRVELPHEPVAWPAGPTPRVAGVSSFGFGGTNTHLVVSDAPIAKPAAEPAAGRTSHVLKLAAKKKDGIAEQARRLAERLNEDESITAADAAYTQNTGRCDFNARASVVADDRDDLIGRLEKLAAGERAAGVKTGEASGVARPKTAMLFTGQGSQRPGMGRELYQTSPLFRSVIDRCEEALREPLGASLAGILFTTEGKGAERINETRYTQPALFALECGVAALWESWGLRPDFLLGHSIGEYAAAVTAGVFSLEDGARLVAERARLMHSAPGHGKMAVLFVSEAEAQKLIDKSGERASVATVNGPENVVISGEAEAIERLFAAFEKTGGKGQMLVVSHAFHSELMDPVLDEFEAFAATIEHQAPSVPIASNVTGVLMTEPPTTNQQWARYWREHLRGAVRYADGVAAVAEAGASLFVEVGPTAALAGMGRRCLPDQKAAWLASLRPGKPEWRSLAESVGEFYAAGGAVDWRGWDKPYARKRIDLPNYPFDRIRCWHDPIERSAPYAVTRQGDSPVLGARLPVVGANTVYEAALSPSSPAFLADHVVQGSAVAPGALYVEQALRAAGEAQGHGGVLAVDDVAIQQAMFLANGATRRCQSTVGPESSGRRPFESHSTPLGDDGPEATWTQHASAVLVTDASDERPEPIDLKACRERLVASQTAEEFYATMAGRSLDYGPAFRVLGHVDRSAYDAVSTVEPTDSVRHEIGERYGLHPVLGDALMQTVAGATPLEKDGSYSPFTYMPVRVARVRLYETVPADEPLLAYAVRRSPEPDSDETSPELVTCDAYLVRECGEPIAAFKGVRVQRVGAAGASESQPADWLHRLAWRETEQTATEPASGPWLLFADQAGAATGLADRLEAAGSAVTLVSPGEAYAVKVDESGAKPRTRVTLPPGDDASYRKLLEMFTANPTAKPAGVAHLWSLDLPTSEAEGAAAKDAWQVSSLLGVGSVMRLVQQAARRGLACQAGVWVLTQGGQAVGDNNVSPLAAPLVGLGRVAQMEHPELSIRLLDMEDPDDSEALAAELSRPGDENQLALTGGKRWAARLEHDDEAAAALDESAAGQMAIPHGPHQLRIPRPGSFEALRYEPITRKTPGPGEVELEIHSAGLNFSDVLKALGLYPGIKDEIVPLGIEASGVVTAVGEGVSHLKAGDEALGVVPYAFGSHSTTAGYALVKKPAGLSHPEAACLPIAWLTAHHALIKLAGLAPGERVLIHAGAGGVGLAAIQIAQHAGAEVFATAGSDEKRDLLRGLGVKHVMNSRTLDFVEEIREATGREGVDVVLNSLPGEAIPASLSVLRAYGRFCEIGKIDIYQDRKLGLLPFQDNLSYFAIDLDRVLRQRPGYVRELFTEVMDRFAAGDYQPTPYTRFAESETIQAFRYMSQRKNIGKVVVETIENAADLKDADPKGVVRSDASYLITGGLGALGLRVAAWLGEQGAGGVVLLARSEPQGEKLAAVEALKASGLNVAVARADVSDHASLHQTLTTLPKGFPALRGVLHAAGVLDDGLLADMTDERFAKVTAPKTVGAWNLHRLSLDTKVFPACDLFVLFSSVAAVLGSPGQSNYAAGNAALDALAHARRRAGLSALSINWGPWAEGGMAAGVVGEGGPEENSAQAIKSMGMDLLKPDAALGLMGRLIESNAAQQVVFDPHWEAMSRLLTGRKTPLLTDLLVGAENAAAGVADTALRQRLASAPADERQKELEEIVRDELARVMGVDADQIEIAAPLSALGLDSLMALELKNNLEGKLAFTLPMAKLLEGPSVATLAEAAGEAIAGDGDEADASTGPESLLVTLRKGDPNVAPLFLLPVLGGDIRCYLGLTEKLPGTLPIVAMRPRGIDHGEPHTDMDAMLDDYTAALRNRQPEGPYSLAGWSTGGVTAFALADRLESIGEKVSQVALFDAPTPRVFKDIDTEDDIKFLLTIVGFAVRFSGVDLDLDEEKLTAIEPEKRFAFALAEAKRAGMFSADADESYVRRLVDVGEALVRATSDYEPRPIEAPVLFFAPETPGGLGDLTSHDSLNEEDWRDAIGQTLAVHTTPGDHFTMMTDRGADSIAATIESLLAINAG
ncbi:Phthioceranic/hydroxyphthioceranic acid synthase [Pseudobythopirellula maris]|uniref:Phthioceranic/hydroxyphthioceranic acid synthase n=1 Tax=Pseudobythopirellula maris TaxID=2527991 RepID=A0A5C5ZQB8_9BACT|nr:type I polyketide synthase [Pseudobythopirellula maris]TWT88483.1 Phthioceranic/hydroxyphthioceranic acid synthase [Pseudobythopirellula maris]